MRAGMFDRRISIERHSGALNAMNELDPNGWAEVATMAADVREEYGREFLQRDQVLSVRRAIFTIRRLGNVTTADRVVFEGIRFNILGRREIGRREAYELHCEAVA